MVFYFFLLSEGRGEEEIKGEGKRKGIRKGEFFPPYTEEDVSPSSVVFIFSVFNFLPLGVIGGSVSPTGRDVFPLPVVSIFYVFVF